MERITRTEVTFEILKVRIVKKEKEEWAEIDVKVTDQIGNRNVVVREGDVLKAIVDTDKER